MTHEEKLALREDLHWLLEDVTGKIQGEKVRSALKILDESECDFDLSKIRRRLNSIKHCLQNLASISLGTLKLQLEALTPSIDLCLIDLLEKRQEHSRFMTLMDPEKGLNISFDVMHVIAISETGTPNVYAVLLFGQHLLKVKYTGSLSKFSLQVEQQQKFCGV